MRSFQSLVMFIPLVIASAFLGTWMPVSVKHTNPAEVPHFIMGPHTITMRTPISTIQCLYDIEEEGMYVCHTFSVPKMPTRLNINIRHVHRYYNIVKHGLTFNVTKTDNESLVQVHWRSGESSGKIVLVKEQHQPHLG